MTKIAETLQEFSSLLLPHDLEQLRVRLEAVDREARVRNWMQVKPGLETLYGQRDSALDALEILSTQVKRWWESGWLTLPANEAEHMPEVIEATEDLVKAGKCSVCGDRNGIGHARHIDHQFTPREGA